MKTTSDHWRRFHPNSRPWVLYALVLAVSVFRCASSLALEVTGDLKQWHRVSVTFDGPRTSEMASPNPFMDYRLNVTFQHEESGQSLVVPGFYAADGNAAESSANAGNKWRVYFCPPKVGKWHFIASFRQGPEIAIGLNETAGRPGEFDGETGAIDISQSDVSGRDFRAHGTLEYVGEHYLRHAGSGKYYLKGGADSPENFLAYHEFDDTFDTAARFNEGKNREGIFLHKYEPHVKDWNPGDPTWQSGKGKGIIGALNYLASRGMNSVYFMPYTIDGGDGKDTWVWTAPDVRDRFDTSKLAQWEIVFSHMDRRGIMLHLVMAEAENDTKLGGDATLNRVRKLYHRELCARFSHHLALIWNLGEENNLENSVRTEIANYIRTLDPYDHPITVHTHNNKASTFYDGLLGSPYFEATSIQGKMENYNQDAVSLRKRSEEAGRPWAIFGDEQPPANVGILPDAEDPEHNVPRKSALWGNLMGGGSGCEWYFGYSHPHMDLNCEDWRSRDGMWNQTRYALDFFQQQLPFWKMRPANELASENEGVLVLAKPGEVYAVYLPNGGTTLLNVAKGTYDVRWYDPRHGGELRDGSVDAITGPGRSSVGSPPGDAQKDWVALVRVR